jgi:DNA processing protein
MTFPPADSVDPAPVDPVVHQRERLARVALGQLGEPGDPRLVSLVAELGAATVRDLLAAERDPGRGVLADVAARLETTNPARDLERADRLGIRFVIPGDDEWPAQVDQLMTTETLHDRGGPPLGLWVRGPMRLEELDASVAVVGSRSATTYGTTVAGEIGARVAREGYTVVSGAAFGIDQAAHRGALAAGGRTVAVLACGVDRAYPARHRALLDHLAATMAVVSELAPGRAPTRIRFLSRNRIIAALTRGTVVVEAAVRSGALNTAGWAARLHRPLMGVPGPVNSAQSEGVHQLVRKGAATLVTRGEEVLELVGASGHHLDEPRRGRTHARDSLSGRHQQVLEAVPLGSPAHSDSIARTAGIGLLDTRSILRRLERAGFVEHGAGGWRIRDADAPDSAAKTSEVPTMNP